MPFGEIGRAEFGTYFIGYAATPEVTEQMLRNMFLSNPPGNTDLLDCSDRGMFFSPVLDSSTTGRVARIRGGGVADTPACIRRVTTNRQRGRNPVMNSLYRELAPITELAWAEIELEAKRTFRRHIAGRRVVDVSEPGGPTTAAVSTGRLLDVAASTDGVVTHLRASQPLVRLRVPFILSRSEIDDVERGAKDSDWEPVKKVATKLAFCEDRAIFEGYEAASITRIRQATSNPVLAMPEDARHIPDAVSQALSQLRLAGVDGPYDVLLSAEVYTKVSETSELGYPIREHLNRLVDGSIIWAPAIDGAIVLTTRGGDFDLQLGTDVAIGYTSHDADTVELYLQETLTFLVYTAEASVALNP